MPTKSYYPTRKVAAILDVPVSTLRYWERSLPQLRPERTPTGHRRYTQADVEMFRLVKILLREKGMSVEYVRKELDSYRKYPPRAPFVCHSAEDAIKLLREARDMVDNAHVVARIDAIEGWIKQTDSRD